MGNIPNQNQQHLCILASCKIWNNNNKNNILFCMLFLELEHIAHYKARNQNTVKTNFCECVRACTQTQTNKQITPPTHVFFHSMYTLNTSYTLPAAMNQRSPLISRWHRHWQCQWSCLPIAQSDPTPDGHIPLCSGLADPSVENSKKRRYTQLRKQHICLHSVSITVHRVCSGHCDHECRNSGLGAFFFLSREVIK